MPRSATARNFGFKRKGLVRILTSADPLEVFLALEDLGLAFPDKPSLLDSIFQIGLDLIPGPGSSLFRWTSRATQNMRGARAVLRQLQLHQFHPTAHGPALDGLLAAANNSHTLLGQSVAGEPEVDPAVAEQFKARIKKAVDDVLPPPKATI